MPCSRCGKEGLVKKGSAVYCAKCALARDWEEIIALAQQERIRLREDARLSLRGPEPADPRSQS